MVAANCIVQHKTLTIGFAILIMDKGRLPSKMQKFLSLSMVRSTWTRTLAMLAVLALAFLTVVFLKEIS